VSCARLAFAKARAQNKMATRIANAEEIDGIGSRKRPLWRVRCHIERIKQASLQAEIKKSSKYDRLRRAPARNALRPHPGVNSNCKWNMLPSHAAAQRCSWPPRRLHATIFIRWDLCGCGQVPTRSSLCLLRESERGEEWRLGLYSRFAEFRETASARRFWFLHRNAHLLYCPHSRLHFGCKS
jgi:hypothetical protein